MRLGDPGVKERLQDLLIDAYLSTLVDAHAGGCVHAVMIVGVTGRSDPDRIRVYTLVVGWRVPVSQFPRAPCGPWRAMLRGRCRWAPRPPVIAHVPVVMHPERDAVRAAARQRLGTYGRLPFYAPQGLEILVRRHTPPQQVATRARRAGAGAQPFPDVADLLTAALQRGVKEADIPNLAAILGPTEGVAAHRVELTRPPQAVFGEEEPRGANTVHVRLGPDVFIALGARAKKPGEAMVGEEVVLVARHHAGDEMAPYERLLGDAIRGDASLFAREDNVEAAWRVVDPILGAVTPVHEYEPRTWGPAEADRIIAHEGGVAQPNAGRGSILTEGQGR